MCDPDFSFALDKEHFIKINGKRVQTSSPYIEFGDPYIEQYFAIPKRKRELEVDDRSIIKEIKSFEDPNTHHIELTVNGFVNTWSLFNSIFNNCTELRSFALNINT